MTPAPCPGRVHVAAMVAEGRVTSSYSEKGIRRYTLDHCYPVFIPLWLYHSS